jgi:LacI family transcriptional regulator
MAKVSRLRTAPQPDERSRPSIEDVAAAAAVSTATVSRFLNSPKLVAPKTAQRVMKVIEELGYRPNRFAQGLMTRRSHTVGILLPDIHGEFYSELLRGADAQAHQRGYHLLVTSEAQNEGDETLRSRPLGLMDGLAIMITEPNERLWKTAKASGVPVVCLDADPDDPEVDSVLIDNAAGAGEAVAHLLGSVPASNCYFVGGPPDNFDTRQRADAFVAAITRLGHKPRAEQVCFGTYSPEWGREWAERIIASQAPKPFGVMAANDEIAFGVMQALQAAGVSIPSQARIVGFDDSRLATLLRPALSTVRVPRYEVGAAAVDVLVDRIEMPQTPVVRKTLPTRLIVRESSKGPAGHTPGGNPQE